MCPVYFYFIPMLLFISLVGRCISFPPRNSFHCLPDFISFLFHSYPGNHFFSCQIYFISISFFISLVARFISYLFLSYPAVYFILISFLYHSSFHWLPDLFHFYFILTQLFISSLFHFYFIPAKLIISLVARFLSFIASCYLVSISFLPCCLFHSFPALFHSYPATWNRNEIDMKQEWNKSGNQWTN